MGTIAYSYWRYSSPEQKDGDSIRRQTGVARAWCARHGMTLDTGHTYTDAGRSAFHGKNRETGVLRRFLEDVQARRVPRGSVLLVENMDRLSREKPVAAINALSGLLLAGVRVVQLAPDELELTEDSDLFTLLRGQLSQNRGHDESKTKGYRSSEAWGAKQDKARADRTVETARVPAWLRVVGRRRDGKHMVGGRFELIAERGKAIRGMVDRAIGGMGLSLIVKWLAESVRPWGRGKRWSRAYVRKILRGRSVLGEYQPTRGGRPDGKPVPGYFPRVIDEETWGKLQDAYDLRLDRRGRLGGRNGGKDGGGTVEVASLFSGLLRDVRTGEKLQIAWQTVGPKSGKRVNGGSRHGHRRRILLPASSVDGGGGRRLSFPYGVFEDALLSRLAEIDPADVVRQGPARESVALTEALKDVDALLDVWKAKMDTPAIADVVAEKLAELGTRRKDLAKRLKDAQARQTDPQLAAWAEAQGLLRLAKKHDARLRLRQLLRAMVDVVLVLVVPRRSHRLAAVQAHFSAGGRRDYLVHYWAAGNCHEGGWEVLSSADTRALGELDLRRPDHVVQLEEVLLALELPR
jgi:DNA invertase Pin-like site-specific DNA recombinase